MTTQATAPRLDGAKVGAFIEQTLRDGAGTFAGVMTVIGDRLGLFRSLAGDGSRRPASSRGAPKSTSATRSSGCAGCARRATSS